MKLSEAISIVRQASTAESRIKMADSQWISMSKAQAIVAHACIANSEALTALLQDAAREGGAK